MTAMNDPRELPVVLVHGFLSTSEMLRPLAWRLEAAGFDVHYTKLSPLCVQDVRKLARQLGRTVEDVLDRTGATQCDLVGISQGGLIAVYYAKILDGGEKIRQLVAVGTPFNGTWAPAAGLFAVPWIGLVSRGLWQTLPRSGLLRQIVEMPMPEGIETTTIGIEKDLIAPPERAHLDEARKVDLGGAPPLVGHQWMVLSPAVAQAIVEILRPEPQ